MNDRSAHPIHADLLSQVSSSEAEDRDVRIALSKRVTDAEITRINAGRLDDVESAIAAYKRAPWPYAPANHAHRYSRGCSGPCEGGAKQCATPEACERAAITTQRKSFMTYLRDLWHDIKLVVNQFIYIRRHLRAGGNPDDLPF